MYNRIREILENSKIDFDTNKNDDHSHHTLVGKIHVLNNFVHRDNKNYEHSFRVNGTCSHRNAETEKKYSHHIVHHVGKVLGTFIKDKKPNSVFFHAANHSRHDENFTKGAKLIAKKTGYVYSKDKDNVHKLSKPSTLRKVGRKLGLVENRLMTFKQYLQR